MACKEETGIFHYFWNDGFRKDFKFYAPPVFKKIDIAYYDMGWECVFQGRDHKASTKLQKTLSNSDSEDEEEGNNFKLIFLNGTTKQNFR